METLGVYISVPFCRSKCSYCNFASGVFPGEKQARYVNRVLAEIHNARTLARSLDAKLPQVVDSVYLGGGTPSILAPELFRRLFSTLHEEFRFDSAPEITVECAPGQLDDEVLNVMAECGVNRISFGVQSFVDREAAVTGRLHTREVALRDIERTWAAGIRSVSVDLIAGLPYQTANSWRESLDVLCGSGVDHASVYMFEVDEDSRLGREVMLGGGRYHAGSVPPDDLIADLYSEAIEILAGSGLEQYEISNFARAVSARSSHNLKYWQRKPYLGFGLDAHSMLRRVDGAAVRFQTTDDLQTFFDKPGPVQVDPLSAQEELEEAWFLGLRLKDGVSRTELEAQLGLAEAQSYDELLPQLSVEGLVELKGELVRLTERGRLLSNEVFSRFLRSVERPEFDLISIE